MPMSTANRTFTLTLKGVDCVNDDVEERIYSLIDDALLSSSNGEVHLDFDREAPSLREAIASACRDVHKAGYEVSSITSPQLQAVHNLTATQTDNVLRYGHNANGPLIRTQEVLNVSLALSSDYLATTDALVAYA